MQPLSLVCFWLGLFNNLGRRMIAWRPSQCRFAKSCVPLLVILDVDAHKNSRYLHAETYW